MSARISSAIACHSLGSSLIAAPFGQPRAAIHRHPAHQLRGDVVAGLAARLPDPLVGLPPRRRGALDLVGEHRPQALGDVVALLGVQVDRVEHRPVDVVLALVVGAVADAHRARALVALEVVERRLLEVLLALDPVHDLQRAVLVARHVGDVLDEVVGLPVEAERVQRPQRERGVAHPAVAVVPVAFAPRASPAARSWAPRRARRSA